MGVYAWADYPVYLLILAVILVFLLKVFERIRFDKKLVTAALPYILVGTFIRVLADVNVFEKSQLWSITPGVYVLTIAIALGFILLGLGLRRLAGVSYEKLPFYAGLGLSLILLYLLLPYIADYQRIAYTLALALCITLAVYAASIPLRIRLFSDRWNLAIVFAHILDASSTYIAYDYYGFYEEHLLPAYMISLTGGSAFIMIPAKLVLVSLVLYFLGKWRLEEAGRKRTETIYAMTRLLLLIIGIGPGLRNTILPALRM